MKRIWLIAVTLLLPAVVQAGGLEPFFHVAICGFEATDIAVVTPTSSKATFQVLETIKGDLKLGETLVFSELYRPEDPSTYETPDSEQGISAEPPPAVQPGDRMIVFLLRPGAQLVWDGQLEQSSTDGWRSANSFGGMRFSTVWLRNGEAFGFFQAGYGPSEFQDLDMTEKELRRQIDKTMSLRATLDRALANPLDSAARAKELGELVRASELIASGLALNQLVKGGAAAAEVLRGLLADPQFKLSSGILDALVKTGVEVPELGQILQGETIYWTSACGSLAAGWLNGLGNTENEKPLQHYSFALAALRGISQLHLSDELTEVRNFHAIWIKCPSLGDNDQISAELDQLLTPQP